MGIRGTTFNVQQFSTDDGPGIRTTIFMKGCPLGCAWCHNPEGISPHPELVWYDTRCIAARECIRACAENALVLKPEGLQIDRAHCKVCDRCTSACPSAALEVIGKTWDVQELLAEVAKDRAFYQTSGGGITVSGGEPMQQAEWLGMFLPACKAEGFHVALDTCGAVAWEKYERVLPFVDLVLFDLKLLDPARHRAATGVSNELILENARRMSASAMRLWIRTPVIPGYTADLENIQAIAQFIQSQVKSVERWDLLAYTNLGKPKYHRLDLPYRLEAAPLLTGGEMERIWSAAVEIVPTARWSGATRPER